MRIVLVLAVVSGAAACKAPNGNAPDSSLGSDVDAALPVGYQRLISRSWTMAPDNQGYRCIRTQVPNDLWISAFRSLSPAGTHHSVLTISQTATTTGEYDCNSGSLDAQMLYAAGVQTDDNELPAGVAIHLAAGTYINLNLHLYNTTDSSLTESSGVLVKTVAQSDVVHEADMQFSGNVSFSVPANLVGDTTTTHDISGHCFAAHDFHIFTLWPHMHQLAVHHKFTLNGVALLDSDYAFGEQKNYQLADTMVHVGDKLETTCTYRNTTGMPVPYGESSNDEMCFTGIYRYPAGGDLLACAVGQPI
jgi:hypothetical protein